MAELAGTADWATVILAGGGSTRLGHDKTRATVAGRALLDHVLSSIPQDVPCIVVGDAPTTTIRPVIVVREHRPGGGPVSGLAYGLHVVTAPLIAVLAADMPFVGLLVADLVDTLTTANGDVDAVLTIDEHSRRQPLAGAYRVAALQRALTILGPPYGRSMRDLIAPLRVMEQSIGEHPASTLLDVDTEDDLEHARRSVAEHTMTGAQPMTDWVTAAAEALEIEVGAVNIDAILDVAREAAHGVERPAAPVSTYLMGYAVAQGMTVEEAAERITRLAQQWPPTA